MVTTATCSTNNITDETDTYNNENDREGDDPPGRRASDITRKKMNQEHEEEQHASLPEGAAVAIAETAITDTIASSAAAETPSAATLETPTSSTTPPIPGPTTTTTTAGAAAASTAAASAAAETIKLKRKIKSKHVSENVLNIRRKIQQCCSTNDLATALELYDYAVKNNVKIEPATFYSLLNLCDGFDRSTSVLHVGTPKTTTLARTKATSDGSGDDGNNGNNDDDDDGDTRSVDLQTRQKMAFAIKEQMKDRHVPLPETAYTALIKILVRNNNLQMALDTIREAESVQQCRVKLRLYSPLLIEYCKQGKLTLALQLWERIYKQQIKIKQQQQQQNNTNPGNNNTNNLQLTEREYAAIMDCCAKYTGDATVFQKVFTDLSEDVLVPSKETCNIIVRWFQSSFAVESSSSAASSSSSSSTTTPTTTKSLLSEVSLPSSQYHKEVEKPIGPVQCPSSHKWVISYDCHIDDDYRNDVDGHDASHSNTGRKAKGIIQDGCLQGEQLQPLQLSKAVWDEMIQMNETIALSGKLDNDISKYQGGKKGKKRKLGTTDQEMRSQSWKEFQTFLSNLASNANANATANDNKNNNNSNNDDRFLDVVIDGANVGFYQQNYTAAPKHVDYYQIDSILQHFLKKADNKNSHGRKQRILLIMHQRHFGNNLMPQRFRPLVQRWEDDGILYKTPPGMNDDWFWMHAALLSGPGTLVLTNDEMRDHHFQMLAPRSFLRWKDRHQIHFSFGNVVFHDQSDNGKSSSRSSSKEQQNNSNGGVGVGIGGDGNHDMPDDCWRGREVILTYPENYSRRIQRVADGYAIPLVKRGDENRFLDGTHVAGDDAPVEETYLCIRPVPMKS